MNKQNWATYKTECYTHDVGHDRSSAGGVHLHQVRWNGHRWIHRIVQVNGRYVAYGPVTPLEDGEGRAAWESAKQEVRS